jgi:hypothetical protein
LRFVTRGLSLLDLLVVIVVLGLLVWAVRLDWQRTAAPVAGLPPHSALASP